jgi:hypothetical protein
MVDYSGDTTIRGDPYFFESSSNRVFVFPFGPNPGDNLFAGVEDAYTKTNGFVNERYTRFPDMARRSSRLDWTNHIVRSMAQITGVFDEPVPGFGFSLIGGSGPFPGSLVLRLGAQSVTVSMLNFPPFLPFPFPEPFLGVLSTDPIERFTFSARRGTLVNSSETFTNRPCGGGPGEVCLASGSIQRSFSSARADITELLIAEGIGGSSASSDAIVLVSSPEPSTGLLLLTALAGVLAFRLRPRRR